MKVLMIHSRFRSPNSISAARRILRTDHQHSTGGLFIHSQGAASEPDRQFSGGTSGLAPRRNARPGCVSQNLLPVIEKDTEYERAGLEPLRLGLNQTESEFGPVRVFPRQRASSRSSETPASWSVRHGSQRNSHITARAGCGPRRLVTPSLRHQTQAPRPSDRGKMPRDGVRAEAINQRG